MIADLYQERIAEPSDIVEHLPTFVELCIELNAQKVIELGVRAGVSTVAWLHGLEFTGGHLWSVDISAGGSSLIPADRWTFIQGNDLDLEVLDRLPELVDIVFIDTTHSFEQTDKELRAYAPHVRSGGRIVLHDTQVEHPELVDPLPAFPVKRAIDIFCDQQGWTWTNATNNNGLGIIEVPEAPC